MMLIVLGVFVGGTLWTVLFSFTNIKILPIFTPKQWMDGFVGFANYKRLFNSDRWMRSEFAVQDQELRNLVERFSLYHKTSMSIVLPQLQELEKIRILVGAKRY